ncbi:MAG: manganese catalase family protein [Tenericutes bacterium]|nr:manganese catalase family protein [Mycoplasmatota bacterium]
MFKYEKTLEYPINIRKKDLKMAKLLVAQFGGPDGELGASLRYLTQRFSMPDDRGKALLSDIGTEELGHVEMICTMIHQLIEGASIDEIKAAGLDAWYTEHNKGVYPMDASGVPFTAAYIASTGNPIVDLQEDLAAEEKARATYENLMDLTNDESLLAPLSFLRQREVVHYTRFKELLEYYKQKGY